MRIAHVSVSYQCAPFPTNGTGKSVSHPMEKCAHSDREVVPCAGEDSPVQAELRLLCAPASGAGSDAAADDEEPSRSTAGIFVRSGEAAIGESAALRPRPAPRPLNRPEADGLGLPDRMDAVKHLLRSSQARISWSSAGMGNVQDYLCATQDVIRTSHERLRESDGVIARARSLGCKENYRQRVGCQMTGSNFGKA